MSMNNVNVQRDILQTVEGTAEAVGCGGDGGVGGGIRMLSSSCQACP